MSRNAAAPRTNLTTADPIGDFVCAILTASDASKAWPKCSAGSAELLYTTPPPGLGQEQRRERLRTLIGDGIRRSAIGAHASEMDWREAACATLSPFNALRSARIICRTKEQLRELAQMIDEARALEFQDPTREPEPAVLLIDELQQQQFQEVFLAPDIDPRTISKEELLLAVSAARVGLHLVKQTTQG